VSSRKEDIANAFQRHFNHFGFKKTSVDDIAKELQISKKTIYQFFDTKEEIFYFVVNRVAQQYVNRMRTDLAPLPTFQEKLAGLLREIFTQAKKWLRSNDAFEFRYKYEIAELAFKDAYNVLFKELIEEGVQSNEFNEVPVEVTVRFVNGIVAESMRLVSANPDLEIEEQAIAAVEKLLK